jgi:molecular chaperone DnaK (HSP70)
LFFSGFPIKVKFIVDVNGIMSVEAIEESTNKQNKILIENKKYASTISSMPE